MSENTNVNRLLNAVALHADKMTATLLQEAYAPVEAVDIAITSPKSQIVYGRRGTGKTHSLRRLVESTRGSATIGVYVDLRMLGSTSTVYADTSLSVPQRATALLADVVKSLHAELLTASFELEPLFDAMDALLDACSDVRVLGEVKTESTSADAHEEERSRARESELQLSRASKASLRRSNNRRRKDLRSQEITHSVTGVEAYRVHFGELRKALNDALDQVPSHTLLVVLDEWSALPLDLQPYLADLLRRTVLANPDLSSPGC